MQPMREMFRTHPIPPEIDEALIEACVRACFDCVQTCTSCADACLAEDSRDEMLHCIRLDQDCADICDVTGRLMSRRTETDWTLVRGQLQACVLACRHCGAECERHSQHHEHCRTCAEACFACAEACNAVLAATLHVDTAISQDIAVKQSFPASDAPASDGTIAPTPRTVV